MFFLFSYKLIIYNCDFLITADLCGIDKEEELTELIFFQDNSVLPITQIIFKALPS